MSQITTTEPTTGSTALQPTETTQPPPPSTLSEQEAQNLRAKLKVHRVTIGRAVCSVLSLLLLTGLQACSPTANTTAKTIDQENAEKSVISAVRGPEILNSTLRDGETEWATLSNGAEIPVQKRNGGLFFQAHGTFSPAAFSQLNARLAHLNETERTARIAREIERIFKSLESIQAIGLSYNAKAGYFRFLAPYTSEVLAKVAGLGIQGVYIQPLSPDRSSLDRVRDVRPEALGFTARSASPRTAAGYSGLERVGALEFARLAEQEIGTGIKVDGSSVKVGITDTGITFNHPTYRSRRLPSRNRIDGMKDFTREGRIYFLDSAHFEVKTGADEQTLVISADVIKPVRLPNLPNPSTLEALGQLEVKVPSSLRALLLAENASGIRAGILDEKVLSSPSEPVDINLNGASDDRLLALLVPGETPQADQIWVDFTGDLDFRATSALGDFNQTGQTVRVFAERIGFDIRADELPSNGSRISLKSASVVGFDPGNHGSHVAGIAAGLQTLANDSSDTLARGFAPEARIYMNRVCANNTGCDATEAFVDLVTQNGVDVVNMSLGGLSPFNDGYGVDETLINRFVESGRVQFMISAGNSGPGKQTVGSPSVADRALSIGATATRAMIEAQYQWPGFGAQNGVAVPDANEDFLLFFSSRGPTAAGGFKPNLTAPGTQLSSIQLNSAPGSRAGLDVYWGTSMAAPAATGAYALLLDAIRKYNLAHADTALPTDSLTLREVLLESARSFNSNRFKPARGESSDGAYTWIDEGSGMINLPAAWTKLKEVRAARSANPEGQILSAVTLNGQPVELDYDLFYNQAKTPNAIPYDGSRLDANMPTFAKGVVFDFHGENTLAVVQISRKIPEQFAESVEYGELTAQLLTTRDEFELDVEIHGSKTEWLKAGTLSEQRCWDSESAPLSVIGRGSEVLVGEDGKGQLISFGASTLQLCVNREAMAQLAPGDHGALVRAYRKIQRVDAEGRVTNVTRSPTASFIVPVHLVVPARTLDEGVGHQATGSVAAFQVSRNYITVPPGVSAMRVRLSVPELKKDARGRLLPGQNCSGVELTSMEGLNTRETFSRPTDARIMNCLPDGTAAPARLLRLEFVKQNPTAGIWDMHVMGLFRYASSEYSLTVDYITGESSTRLIEGVAGSLNGELSWQLKTASVPVHLSAEKSALALSQLLHTATASIQQGEVSWVTGPTGSMRTYPPEVKTVSIRTDGATGSDIDLRVAECSSLATSPADPTCRLVGVSAGGTSTERVDFEPSEGFAYVVLVDGYEVANGTQEYQNSERLVFHSGAERYPVALHEKGDGRFDVNYALSAAQLATSTLGQSELFQGGLYQLEGALALKNADGLIVDSIAVRLTHAD